MSTPNNTTPRHTSVSADETPDYQFSESASPCGFDRSTFTAPHLPGADWDTVYSGVCMDLPNQGGVENQPVLMGDTLTLSRPAQLAVFMRADDLGDLLITTETLTEAEVRQRIQDTPVYDISQPLPAGDIHLQYDLSGERWQEADAGADSWKNLADFLVLPAGTYRIYGTVTNVAFPGGNNINNRKLFRYALLAKRQKEEKEYRGALRRICSTCGCGQNDDGDADNQAATQAPGWEGDPCPSLVTLNPETGKALYDSPWRWTLALTEENVVITPPTGEPLLFSVPDEGETEAGAAGDSAMAQNRVQYQDSAFAPTTSRTPAYIMMKDETDLCLTFDVATGMVHSITTAEGRCVTAAERARHVQTQFDAAGNLLSCASAEGELLCTAAADGTLQLEWYAPRTARAAATPFKAETISQSGATTTITRSQRGLPAHTLVRRVDNGIVTITKGTGAAAIVHRYATAYPVNGLMQRTESVYFAATPENKAACTRMVYNYSAAGWQLYAVTEGYGTSTARTTRYTYNAADRLTKVQHADGGYTTYGYDSHGRVVREKSPWGADLAKVTLTTYAGTRFFSHRPATVAEYHETADGTRVLYRSTAYSYETTPAAERTTITVTAGNSSQQQVSIEETFGTAPAYAYAAGKMKFSQAANGVQTFHSYEAAHAHGAVHKHTVITKANNELIAAQSRKTESYLAADNTVTYEETSLWDGTQWLLLSSAAYEYDAQQRRTRTTRGNGRSSVTEHMCCGVLSETDENGIRTDYAYDSALQLTEITRAAVYDGETCITPETITEYTRDAAGRVLTTTRRIGALTTTEHTAYDALGRVVSRTDTLGRTTTTAYSANGLTTTVTTPAGATLITTLNTDGSTASLGGTGQRETHYVYDLIGSNERATTQLPNGSILGQSITNGFGQTVVQAQPNTLGGFIYSRSEYNDKGELTRQYQDTGFGTAPTASTLYEYDAFGNQVKQTLALCDAPTPLNSPVIEMSYGVETAEDGVYSVATQTRYNAEGNPIPTTQKQLLSQLSATLASKSISVDARGNSTVQWAEHTAPAKVTSCSTIPGSALTAQTVSVDGFTTSMLDHAGITGSATRHFTETGMVLTQTDGRGNTTTTVTDIAGRTVSVTDAAGNTTTTAYCACCDNPAVVTDAMGNTSCYKYDLRGRKLAEWGTAIQPACFSYDDMGNMISLRTFRADGEVITTDPSVRSDYDETTWAFHATTGLEMSKTYADNTSVLKTYDAYNRLATETDARGNVKTHSYEHARGLHLGTTYTVVDGTAATADRSFTYNHLSQLTQLMDDSGVRSFTYNTYGEQECDSLAVDGDTHLITETRDSFGRSTGYAYAKNGNVQQTVTTGYGSDGRISSAGFTHGGEQKLFGYTYLAGSNLLQVVTKPNGMTLTQTYEATRNLLTDMVYHRGSTLVAQRTYTYDILGRPTARNTARQGTIVNDSFAHNSRSELAEATVSGKEYEYTYDNIGNRQSSIEDNNVAMYDTNNLNQYTSISENGAAAFVSQFDADGNQTLIKTETGTWSAVYNAENRPATFTNSESNTVVECAYDSMGRRAYKKVSVNGSVTLHQRYIYRGYLQIACIDLTRSHHPALWYITWDVTQPVATRPLAIQINGTWYTYGWDLTKNICELYSTGGIIATTYTYSPFGKVTATGSLTQPIQWSSEFNDTELGLVYYNWRYYNVLEGRWNIYDSIVKQRLYDYCGNNPIRTFDCLGLIPPPEYQGGSVIGGSGARSGSYKSLQIETDHIRDDFTRDQPEDPKKTSQILNNFDTEVKKHKRHYEHTGCKFVISYSREGNNPGEKFDTVAVLNKVKQVISNNLTNAIHIVDKHEYQAMNSALGEIKCICGIIFIGHAGSTDGPSRLIFDNATSIATETDSTNSGRYLYSSLNTENFVQNNLSLLLGCRSASDKRFSKVLKMEFEKEGKFISIAEALSQHFKGTVIGSYNKLNFDGGVPYTPSHAGGNDFRIFYNYIQ